MERVRRPLRRVQIQPSAKTEEDGEALDGGKERLQLSTSVSEMQEPFMGVKARRGASLHREYNGDYLKVASDPFLMKILEKHGDTKVLFADSVLKFTGSGKIKRRGFLITEISIYIVDLEAALLKRRISLSAVQKILLSELSDNYFAIIVQNEYDCLMASTRKSEIVSVLAEATKDRSISEIDICFFNRFEYRASAENIKEVQFEEVEDGK
ncbi:Unconventional myosin-Ie [Nymphaea thermarum]|nr:Unconventional myosin-Ie [Nymphaea thermarum]